MSYQYKGINENQEIELTVQQPNNISRNLGQLAQTAWLDENHPNSTINGEGGFSNLLSCMEIDWGNAKFNTEEFINIDDLINNNGLKNVKSSYDILRLLFWCYQKINKTPEEPVIERTIRIGDYDSMIGPTAEIYISLNPTTDDIDMSQTEWRILNGQSDKIDISFTDSTCTTLKIKAKNDSQYPTIDVNTFSVNEQSTGFGVYFEPGSVTQIRSLNYNEYGTISLDFNETITGQQTENKDYEILIINSDINVKVNLTIQGAPAKSLNVTGVDWEVENRLDINIIRGNHDKEIVLVGNNTSNNDIITTNKYTIHWDHANNDIIRTFEIASLKQPQIETNYFYVGTTKPTSISQTSTVTSYPSEQIYTNNSGAKSHIFVLTNSDKFVTFIAPSENSPITQVSVDTTTISGYKIFETAVGIANNKSVKIQIS